ATTTSITTIVPPAAASGPITVTTSRGTATSSDDFIIPPPLPQPGETVEYLGRIAFGETKTVTITAPDKVGLLTFTATAGLRANLRIIDTALDGVLITILGPTGDQVESTSLNPRDLTGPLLLPRTGTYSILIDHFRAEAGNITLTLYNVPPDVTGTIAIGGPPVTANLTAPGQIAKPTFSGTTGQRLRLSLTAITITPFGRVEVFPPGYEPDVTTPILQVDVRAGQNRLENLPILDQSGNYTITVIPDAPQGEVATGSITLMLLDADGGPAAAIAVGGPPVTATVTLPGLDTRLTFNGNAGQIVALDQFGATLNNPRARMIAPNGTRVFGGPLFTLPLTGGYTIRVGSDTSTGTIQSALYEIPPLVTGTITLGGPPMAVTIPTSGQQARLNFNGTAGQQVSLKIVGTTLGPSGAVVTVVTPGDRTLIRERVYGENRPGETVRLSEGETLPETGTYSVFIEPDDSHPVSNRVLFAGTGTVTVTLYNVPLAPAATIVPDGPPVTVTTTVTGQKARLTFNGTAGQVISLKGTNPTFVSPIQAEEPFANIRLLDPQGSELGPSDGQVFVGPVLLSETGSYAIEISILNAESGSLTLNAYNVPAAVTNTISANGSPVTVTTTAPGQDVRLIFNGVADQKISLKISNPYILGSLMSISAPEPQPLEITSWVVENPAGTRNEFLGTTVLPLDGTYTIRANAGDTPGSKTFTLFDIPPEVDSGVLTLGGQAVTITAGAERQDQRLTFTGTPGQDAHLRASNPTGIYRVKLYSPDGTRLFVCGSDSPDFVEKLCDIGRMTAGTYALKVEMWGANSSLAVALKQGPPVVTGTISPGGPPVTVT